MESPSFCKQCGTKLSPDAKFCESCGSRVTQVTASGDNLHDSGASSRSSTASGHSAVGLVPLVIGLGLGFFAHMHRPEADLSGDVTWALKANFYYSFLFLATLIVIAAVMRLINAKASIYYGLLFLATLIVIAIVMMGIGVV